MPLELRLGDVRELELDEPRRLIYVPFRSLLHLHGWQQSGTCSSVSRSLRPGGRFAFNAFVFSHTIAARLDGTTQDQGPASCTSLHYAPADNRIEIERDDAATIRLWWAAKSNGKG